jgi:putative endonuclease
MKYSFVYILASQKNGTLYIGVTSELKQRVFLHKQEKVDGFTKKYRVNKLVYYEVFEDIDSAIIREKQLKEWKRKWKIELIEKKNIEWTDMYDKL